MRKKLTPFAEPTALVHTWPSWPGWVCQSVNLYEKKLAQLGVPTITKGWHDWPCHHSWFVQLKKNKLLSPFKDFSRTNWVFKHKDLLKKSAFFSPSWTPYRLKHVMESLTIFTSSAIVDHIIIYYFPEQHFAKWLGMTCNCIWGT